MTRAFDRASLLPSDKVTPHIVPDVLFPAVAGKLLDGTTSHSGNYGDAQNQSGGDGRKYYYTDIKGSKPIRDPRIGAYFGTQRHKWKTLQLLKQETATHGENVYSIDGREWIRGNVKEILNDASGNYIDFTQDGFIEITGYWSSFNIIFYTATSTDNFKYQIDGASAVTSDLSISVGTPLHSRYVDAGSVHNLVTGQTLGIHTIKLIRDSSTYSNYFYGCELIAQDTTSSTTRNQIQIPSQTVVSFGSKFSLSASTPHYHPFNTKSDGTAWSSPTSGTTNTANSSNVWPVVDTATSLGLSAWVNTSYYRPYNGGRVVIWVDENGEIKTSVNMMPPNARHIGATAISEKGDDSAGNTSAAAINNLYTPTFTDQAIDHSQSEVAKTYRFREFGNGSANAGSNSGNYKDFSMLSGTSGQDNGFVMDDGLTSLSGETIEINGNGLGDNLGLKNSDAYIYYTFIGTGITLSDYNGDPRTFAQNLPYGSHIVFQDHDGSNVDWFIDGAQLLEGDSGDTGITVRDITFHQPKMPPIPEDCVILADYMLMADFVTQTDNTDNLRLSKGVRLLSASRDVLYDSSASISGAVTDTGYLTGLQGIQSGNTMTAKLPFFGSSVIVGVYDKSQSHTMDINSSTNVTKALIDGPHVRNDKLRYNGSALDLGVNVVTTNMITGGYPYNSTEIVTPIHTSHHYKTFETPFLHELIGGDRNMEQTHLICSADGKTWDEVTRNTSYLSQTKLSCQIDHDSGSGNIVFDEWRGQNDAGLYAFNKNFAIASDRLICLQEGTYQVNVIFSAHGSGGAMGVSIYVDPNQTIAQFADHESGERSSVAYSAVLTLKKDDVLIISNSGTVEGTNPEYNQFSIVKL